ncbi:unnamed protein product [Ilex paraguariensis]|uniref:J domain-containing protein n=1 Tax=Ilex paraguariensis TaxID=185542 RepID=A0ABC8UI48_9AQUA
MIGTLILPAAACLRFSPENTVQFVETAGSNRKKSISGRISYKSAIHAAVAEAPAVETRMPPASLYDVLRVRRNASPIEIKMAYRSLAKMYHPDSSHSVESDGRNFIEIHNAYATLSDPEAKAVYDLKLSIGSRGPPVGYPYRSGYYPTRRWETDQCW